MAAAAAAARPPPGTVVRLLRLTGFPILAQLQIEEALLRATPDNWFVINDGTPKPSVVLGVSVVVDGDTIFTALIMQQQSLPGVEAYPRPVMQYTEDLYRSVFGSHGAFWLRENDYCFGDRKFGGNAQAITKDRWLHHTSLLWDFKRDRMALLQQPAKQPAYRQGRHHLEFILPLHEVLPCRRTLIDELCGSLETAGFVVREAGLGDAERALAANTLCGTRLLDMQQLLDGVGGRRQGEIGQQATAAAVL